MEIINFEFWKNQINKNPKFLENRRKELLQEIDKLNEDLADINLRIKVLRTEINLIIEFQNSLKK